MRLWGGVLWLLILLWLPILVVVLAFLWAVSPRKGAGE